MRIETVQYNVYKFEELSEKAKEKARQWYLDNMPEDIFTEDCIQDLHNLFGENIDLNIQYSLSYCQGDGFNIYGTINAKNIFTCLEKHNGGSHLEEFENVLTNEEKEIILQYQEVCNNIELPMNNRYCYSLASYIDIIKDWQYDLENYSEYKNINIELLQKFEKMVQDIFETLCKIYEEQGYQYFYEVDDADLSEICEYNDWEFLEDGTFFYN